jgi:hypothetical protein
VAAILYPSRKARWLISWLWLVVVVAEQERQAVVVAVVIAH